MFPKKVPEFIEHIGSVPDPCLIPMPRWNQNASLETSEASASSVNENLTRQLQESIMQLMRLQSELPQSQAGTAPCMRPQNCLFPKPGPPEEARSKFNPDGFGQCSWTQNVMVDPMPPCPQHVMVDEFEARTRPVHEKSRRQLQKEWSSGADDEEEVFDLAMPSAPSLELCVDLLDPPTLPSPSSGPQFVHEAPSSSRSDGEQIHHDLAEQAPKYAEMQHARSLAAAGHGLSGFTTVMMQQIPFKYTQPKLMNEINEDGFEGTYDFLYLPGNARSHGSRGFGFINFLSSSLAEKFYRRYLGQKLKHHEAASTITMIPADVQGFEESAARFFSAWLLRKKKHQTMPAFLKPIPTHIAKSQTHGTLY